MPDNIWFHLVTEHAIELIGLTDLDGRIVHSSPSCARFLGRDPSFELTNVHPDDVERSREWWRRIVSGGTERLKYRLRSGEGEWRWFDAYAVVVPFVGRPHVLISSRDVTDEVRAIEALRDRELKLLDAERIAHLGYWENDLLVGRITWSAETYRILGLPPDGPPLDIAGFRERMHPDDVAAHVAAVEPALRAGGQWNVVSRIIRPDGAVRTVHAAGEVVRNGDGRPTRAFGVLHDITEQKRAEEERTLLRTLLDHSNDAIEVIEPNSGRFLDVNEAACHGHGYSRAEYLSLRVADVSPLVAERTWPVVREEARRHGSRMFESTHRRKDGSTFPVEINLTFVRRDRGEHILAIVRDISERKRAEEDLRRMEEQFRHAQKMEAVGRLAGGVAHDFNNLLTVIQGNSELVMEQLGDAHPTHSALAEIREAGARATELTHHLLAFCRKQVLLPRVVVLDQVLLELLQLLRRVIGEDVRVELVRGASDARVLVDPGQFEHAILNLAVNARDAMPNGGMLRIETRKEDNAVVVVVSDTGQGIDEATRTRIFEPFFTTKEPGRGTGLGLAMVHGFVEQSGGHIDVQSELGRGTSFTIRLPRTSSSQSAKDAAPQRDRTGSETVLLVEDEEIVRRLTKRVLVERGYVVLDAPGGAEALTLAREYPAPIDLLVTDLVMPGMNGHEVAGALARDRPEMRILLMSGYSDLPIGGLAFLQKPFGPKDLARKVREVLDRTA